MFNNTLGIDFGTDTIKICDRKNRITVCEKNMIAIREGNRIIAIGDQAYDMYEKTPMDVKATCPMKNGVIAEARNAEIVLSYLLKKHKRLLGGKPTVFIAVPRDISAVEKRAYYNVLNGTVHARKILLVDKGIADNIGVGVSMASPRASMLVNLGAGTTEISVVAGGKVLLSRTLSYGGCVLDEEIVKMVRRMYHLNISSKMATRLKTHLAYVGEGIPASFPVMGISAVSGLPEQAEISSESVSAAITDTINYIASELRGILDRLPPQFYHDIMEAGLCLCGGSSLIRNLSEYFQYKLGIPISIVREPGLTTLRGIQQIMSVPELSDYTYSLKDLTGSVI